MKSQELGMLFEHATSKILTELFQLWGYHIDGWKAQKSGTQHGFDVYFKLSKKHARLNVFVECKASEAYNKIPASQLTRKASQLVWAGFPEKDILIHFSPTRAIDFDNEQLTIEDDSYPFVIVDWMRQQERDNLVMELFAAYPDYGNDSDILEFCNFLFSSVDPGFHKPRTFAEICGDLKSHFDRRVADHVGKGRNRDYSIINGAFWSQIQDETHTEFLHQYYTRANASTPKLREVVANEFYIKNETLDKQFDQMLSQAIKSKAGLIKILSKGGEGKSTFLYQIAKTYYGNNTVVWLEDVKPDVLAEIDKHIRSLDTVRPIMLLLDNAAVYGKPLIEFAERLTTGFRRYHLVFIVAEREFRYRNIEEIQSFEAVFNESYEINYKSIHIRKQVFDKLILFLNLADTLPEDLKQEAEGLFVDDRRKGLTECTFSVIKHLKAAEQLKGYRFDWEDWEAFAEKRAPKLQRLYLILSTFYQFGFSLDIQFCVSLLQEADYIEINSALSNNPNLPIYKRGHHLLLPHETIASWYLDDGDESGKVHRQNSEEVFKTFISNITTPFARDLFIRLCIKTKDFRNSYLAQYVSKDRQISILESFIKNNTRELKCRTELSKIYQYQKKWDDAIRLLKEYIELAPEGLHPRTELSKIYQHQKKWKEAETVLLESLKIDPEQLHPRTELSKIYQHQKKWKEAETVLLECLEIDPNDLNSRTELSKIYQHQKMWREAENILLELLKFDIDNLQARTELSKIYQHQKKWREAENILLELLKFDIDNLHSRTELSKIYQRQKKWKEAEDILLELLKIDTDNLQARTELSKIYQHQEKWKEAEDILLECLEIDLDDLNSRTELSKIYQKQNKLQEAERLLQECLDINSDDLNSLLELGKIFSKDPERYIDAEQRFQRILQIEQDNLHARLELALLYRRMGKYGLREKILFEIYETHPQDVPTLADLARVFTRFRKFRVALRLLEEALKVRNSDILIISNLIKLYVVLQDKENVTRFLSRGKVILEKDPHNRHRERFSNLDIEISSKISLVNLYEVGFAARADGQRRVQSNNGIYSLREEAIFNNKLMEGDKVFFATYTKEGQVFADFVEPYFETIDHLEQLI
jgi:tetratricopeptide (TPR) repeat protein